MRVSMMSAAVVAALVGFGSTIALVLAAAAAVSATPAQTASWVLAVSPAKAAGSAWLFWRTRVPVVLAWSTPGAALVAATEGLSLNAAVGAFIVSGLLVVATGAIRPLGRLVAQIPDAVAAAMLAGVLLPFVLRLAGAVQGAPGLILPVAAVFLAVRLKSPAFAVLAALVAGVATGLWGQPLPDLPLALPLPVRVTPEVVPGVILGLGLPLFLVTMASQNLPGFATLRAAGYEPPVGPALRVTGGLSAVSALFGAHPVSMAAITAAICLGPDVDADPARRWRVGRAYTGVWTALGLFGPAVLALIAALPAEVVTAVVALALMAPLTGALTGAFQPEPTRFAAAVTLTVTASGVAALGVGAAFWGLVAGLAVAGLDRAARAWGGKFP